MNNYIGFLDLIPDRVSTMSYLYINYLNLILFNLPSFNFDQQVKNQSIIKTRDLRRNVCKKLTGRQRPVAPESKGRKMGRDEVVYDPGDSEVVSPL